MPAVAELRVDGLRDFQAALKNIDGEMQKQLRVVLNGAAELVAATARRFVPQGKSGKARKSVRVASSQREAIVRGGGARVPYYGWLDFGGTVGRGRTGLGGTASAQARRPGSAGTAGSVVRPFIARGRYIYPSYDVERPEVLDAMQRGLLQLAVDSGLVVE